MATGRLRLRACRPLDDDGNVARAEMRWGSDLIMFGTARDNHYGDRVGKGWVYATCDDPDAL